jgi:hypothetical protein
VTGPVSAVASEDADRATGGKFRAGANAGPFDYRAGTPAAAALAAARRRIPRRMYA